ncbi:GGDEF domain-containing protein [Paroceanicella profunda]|uniref:GGDEF domain-containing protein n=1 Tax=Paroceanicella profunda TaxID=2579971 RepID=UPI001478117C|nr:GGDEF domain-containing protein [Paroceanicella profunda]
MIALFATVTIAWTISLDSWSDETRRLSSLGAFYDAFGDGVPPGKGAGERRSVLLSPDLSLTLDTLVFAPDAAACRARLEEFRVDGQRLDADADGAEAIATLCGARRYALLRRGEAGPLISLMPLVSADGALTGAQVNVISAAPRPTLPGVLSERRVLVPALVAAALAMVLGGLLGRSMRGHVTRLSQRASVDGLTGALRREAFFLVSERAMRRCRRKGGHVALLAIDLDRLKTINDTRGHAGGDAALSIAASALRTALREGDLLGRLGGDEFAVLLPGVTPAAAEAIAERARLAVEEANGVADFGGVRLSVSVGLVHHDGVEALREMVDRADARLYEAKRLRNTVAS